jgi:hypothetical protein
MGSLCAITKLIVGDTGFRQTHEYAKDASKTWRSEVQPDDLAEEVSQR